MDFAPLRDRLILGAGISVPGRKLGVAVSLLGFGRANWPNPYEGIDVGAAAASGLADCKLGG